MKYLRALLLAGACVAPLLTQSVSAETLGPDTGMRWQYTPADIVSLCKSTLDAARARTRSITAHAADHPGFADGLGAIETMSAELYETLSAPTTLSQFATAKDVRDAATDCSNDFAAFGVELAADPRVYVLAQAALAGAHDGEEHQLAEIYVENGRHSGAALDAPRRAEAQKMLNELNRLQIDFGRELGEDHTTLVLSKAALAPLPPALGGAITRTPQGGSIAVNESTLAPFMNNEPVREARHQFMLAYDRRGGTKNIDRLSQAVALRQRLAVLLGYPNWAAYQLDINMAKTPARAEALVLQVDRALLPKARAEIRELADLKRAGGDTTPFLNWDYRYYEQQLVKNRYAVDTEEVRNYFAVDHVLPAVLDLYARLLGIRFLELQKPDAWAPLVREYAIYDAASGEGLGWFYLDLYPREGKYDHFAAFALRLGRELPEGSHRKPVSAIIGNWPVPAPGKPTLLSHDELLTFFHEFGHVMHQTLGTSRYASLFGSNTRQDFPEAPSQMLENWMWQPTILKRISAHVDTGAPMPDELVQRLIAVRNVDAGIYWCRQALFAEFDLKLHLATAKVDPLALMFELAPKLYVFPEIPGSLSPASFNHIMSGLAAGYYGYLWSKVYAQDMFTVFERDGLESGPAGKRYRDLILAPGGSDEPDVLLRNFLGRPVSPEPFYATLGIKSPAPTHPTPGANH